MEKCKFESAWVNGVDIRDIGDTLLESYTVGGTEITNEIYQGRNRTHYNLLAKQFGRKTVTMTVFFHAMDRHMLTLKQSKLTGMLAGLVDLVLPDRFHYRATLDEVGDLQILGADKKGCIAECTYTLSGIQHDELKTLKNGWGKKREKFEREHESDLIIWNARDLDYLPYRLGSNLASAVFKNGTPLTAERNLPTIS